MKLTCDRTDKLIRAAVWKKGKLTDLYIDLIDKPDLSGALLNAKLVRVMAGERSGWFDAGLDQTIYVDNSKEALQAGVLKQLRIQTSFPNGKACRAVIVGAAHGEIGIVEQPPSPWQRALADIGDQKVECHFMAQEDYDACQEMVGNVSKISLAPLASFLPDMSERIDELECTHVVLNSGGEIVIEPTEALIAIDINVGKARNALSVNLAAMHEIASQIRLRNLGGIIIIDALKMSARADKGKVLSVLRRVCADDPAGVEVFGMTKLGLIELTRKRRGPSL